MRRVSVSSPLNQLILYLASCKVQRQTVAYLECAIGASEVWGDDSPQWVQEQSPGRESGVKVTQN